VTLKRVNLHICHQHGTGNGSETTSHDLVKFRFGKMRNEGTDQHGRLSLADERRGGSDNGLGTRDLHGPEEEDGEFSNEPLEDTPVVQKLDERHEEDDRRHNTGKEPRKIWDRVISQENHTLVSETQKQTGELGNESEDIVSGFGPQDEQGNDELAQHADNDGVPYNLGPVAGGGPEEGEENYQAEQTDGAVGAGVVQTLLASKRSHDDDSDGQSGASRDSHLLGHKVADSDTSVVPNEMHWLGNNANGDPEEDQPQHDGEPEKEWNNPVLVLAMDDDTSNPPSEPKLVNAPNIARGCGVRLTQ
jgi:hypothetical protein